MPEEIKLVRRNFFKIADERYTKTEIRELFEEAKNIENYKILNVKAFEMYPEMLDALFLEIDKKFNILYHNENYNSGRKKLAKELKDELLQLDDLEK